MSTNGFGDGSHDDVLNSFERNRWFYGKMVTPRDLTAEWRYHADRLDTLTRHVLSEGIVTGLETTVEQDGEDGELTVTVQPGLAVDRTGRQIVVPRRTSRTLAAPTSDVTTVTGDPPATQINLYLTYDECVKEAVPLSGFERESAGGQGSGNPNGESSEYNRVLEIFDVEYGPRPPETYREPATLDMPGRGEGFQSLLSMIGSYHDSTGGDELQATFEGNDAPVFLGTFTRGGGGGTAEPVSWEFDASVARRYAYTTDLLYAAVAAHLLAENPHGLDATDVGALRSINGRSGTDGELTLTSPDSSVTITTPDETPSEINIEVDTIADTRAIEDDRLARSLGVAARSFDALADRIEVGVPDARRLAVRARDAFDNRAYEDDAAFLGAFGGSDGLDEVARAVQTRLQSEGISGFMRLDRVLGDLSDAVDAATPSSLAVAIALLRLCEAADAVRDLKSVHFADFAPDTSSTYPLSGDGWEITSSLSNATFVDEWPSSPGGPTGDGFSELTLPEEGITITFPESEYLEIEVIPGNGVIAVSSDGTRREILSSVNPELKHTLVFDGVTADSVQIFVDTPSSGAESLVSAAFRPAP